MFFFTNNRWIENYHDNDLLNSNSSEENNVVLKDNLISASKMIGEGNELFTNSLNGHQFCEQILKFMTNNKNINNVTNDILVLNYVKQMFNY